MKDRYSRDEYVLNDQGIIWRGTHDQMKPTHWNFAQVNNFLLYLNQFEKQLINYIFFCFSV